MDQISRWEVEKNQLTSKVTMDVQTIEIHLASEIPRIKLIINDVIIGTETFVSDQYINGHGNFSQQYWFIDSLICHYTALFLVTLHTGQLPGQKVNGP